MTNEEAIKWFMSNPFYYSKDHVPFNMAIEALKQMDALDKIREEIETAYEDLDGYDCNALPTYIGRVLAIIDKYRKGEEE